MFNLATSITDKLKFILNNVIPGFKLGDFLQDMEEGTIDVGKIELDTSSADYGIDMNGKTITSKSMRLENGETIGNGTDGVVDISGKLDVPQIGNGDTDSTKIGGFLTTRNNADSSMYIPVATTSGNERGMKVCYAPVDNDGGYFDALFANVKVASDSTPSGIVRAVEAKATVEGNMGASAEAHGIYSKVNVSGASAEVSKAIGVDILLEEESSGTITEGTGLRVQGGSGAVHYGIDVSGDYGAGAVKVPYVSVAGIGASTLASAFGVAEGAATDARYMGIAKDTNDSNKLYEVYMIEGAYKYGAALTDAT